MVIEDTVFAEELRTCLITAMEAPTVKLDPQLCADRPWQQRALDRLAFGVMRLLLFLTGRRY